MDPAVFWLAATCLLAGLVYGFAGFGAALIYMPIAVTFLEPVVAVSVLSISALASFVTVVPQAWRDADRRASLYLLGAALCAAPFGIYLLRTTDPAALRFVVSILVFLTLAALLAGWRYRQAPGVPAWLMVGAGVGFMGGATGLNGPLMILFQLGGQDEIARTRANTIVLLSLSGFALFPLILLQGGMDIGTFWLGVGMLLPYGLGGYIGRRLFNPARAGLYRATAYVIIGLAGLMGLPIWEG